MFPHSYYVYALFCFVLVFIHHIYNLTSLYLISSRTPLKFITKIIITESGHTQSRKITIPAGCHHYVYSVRCTVYTNYDLIVFLKLEKSLHMFATIKKTKIKIINLSFPAAFLASKLLLSNRQI